MIAFAPRQELAGDERHHARNAGTRSENLVAMLLKTQMVDDLRHDFSSCTCRHGLPRYYQAVS
jgi:hypothetical protein